MNWVRYVVGNPVSVAESQYCCTAVLRKDRKEKRLGGPGGSGALSFQFEEEEDSEGEREREVPRQEEGTYAHACMHEHTCMQEQAHACTHTHTTCACFLSVAPPVFKKRKVGKNPNVDTSFLPDRDREVRPLHF